MRISDWSSDVCSSDLPARVFLVDDHQMFRSGVRAELGDGVVVVGEAADVESAVAGIRATQPEVVLLDVHLHGGGGQLGRTSCRQLVYQYVYRSGVLVPLKKKIK